MSLQEHNQTEHLPALPGSDLVGERLQRDGRVCGGAFSSACATVVCRHSRCCQRCEM